MKEITWSEFELVELRSGTVIDVQDYPEARKPAYKITVDFGEEIGVKKTSAQITDLYSKDDLIGKQLTGVVNFPNKQIGKFISEFLLTGFIQEDNSVVLAVPDKKISEYNSDTIISELKTVGKIKDSINNSTNVALETKSCKGYCGNNAKDHYGNSENCGRPEGCRNSESYDDGLNVKFTI